MDFPERTSEEERKAVAKFPYAKKPAAAAAADDDDLFALLAAADDALQPIHVMDTFTYWVKRLVGETVYADCRIAPDPSHDSAAVLADKQLYVMAVTESASFKPCSINLNVAGNRLAELVAQAKVIIPTADDTLNCYPENVAFVSVAAGERSAAPLVLHVLSHFARYVRSAIIHCCRSQGGQQEVYLEKSYDQLWVWLIGEANKELPISAWPAQSGLPFVDYMRALWRLHTLTV